MGLKQWLIRGLLIIQAWGEGGTEVITGMQGEPAAAEAGVILQQPEAHHVFSQGTCLWIMGPWQWRAAQAPRGVWIVTCACTQASWWLHSSVSISCPSLWSELIAVLAPVSGARLGSALPSFSKSEVFCQRSVGVLLELFHM